MNKPRETIDSLIAKLQALREVHGGDTPVVRLHGRYAYVPKIETHRLAADESKLVSRQGKAAIAIS